MLMQRKLVLAVLCLALLAAPVTQTLAQGVSPDKYFPEGTDAVVQLNLNQLMGSTLLKKGIPLLVKKHGENVVSMLANFVPDENVKKMMQDMAPELKNTVTEEAVGKFMEMGKGFVKDFTFAINSREEANGVPNFVISMGIPMLQSSMIEQFAPMMSASGQMEIKTEDIGGVTYFEMKPTNSPMPFYVAVPENGIMLMGISKDTLTKTVKNKGKNQTNPNIKDLLNQRKNTYTLFVAGLAPKNQEDEFKHFVATLTVDKDVNGNVNMVCPDADKAKAKAKEANEGFESAVAMVLQFADDHPELKPLSDSLKKVKAETNGNTISMKMSVDGEQLIKAMKEAK